jgi:hypothetical protein
MATPMNILQHRYEQYLKMKAAQKKYNQKRWAEMKEAREVFETK